MAEPPDAPRPDTPDARRRALREFQARWILVTTVGLPLALIPAYLLFAVAPSGTKIPPGSIAFEYGATMFEGALLGLLQASVLRSEVPRIRSTSWIAASGLGTMAAWLAVRSLEYVDSAAPVTGVVWLAVSTNLVLLGGLRSVFQWCVLRKHVPGAWMWLLANSLAWVLLVPLLALPAAALILLLSPIDRFGVLILALAATVLSGALLGTLQGLVLKRLIVGRDARRARAP